MKNLILISCALQLGGIETLIVRTAKAWGGRGVRVTVLLLSRRGDADLLAQLQAHARVVYLDELMAVPALYSERLSVFNWFQPLSHARVHALLAEVDHVHFVDSFTMMVAARLIRIGGRALKITGGVYHQYEYAYARLRGSYFVKGLTRHFAAICLRPNLIFFNEISKVTLSRDAGVDFSASPLLPIGIDLSSARLRLLERVDRRKIVSIGRITSFKTYNVQFLKALSALAAKGVMLDYHVYGDGEDLPALKAAILECGLTAQVILHGPIPYSNFRDAIADAFLFLGSGTALIEAAACGVPALIGIESQHDDQTYGLLHEMSGLSYHEQGLAMETQSFQSFVEQLAALTPEQYAQVCVCSAAKAREFSLDIFMDRFLDADAEAVPLAPTALPHSDLLRFLVSMSLDRLAHRYRREPGFWGRYDGTPQTVTAK